MPSICFPLPLHASASHTPPEAETAPYLGVFPLPHTPILCISKYFKAEFKCHLFREALPPCFTQWIWDPVLSPSYSSLSVSTIYLWTCFLH